MNSIREGEANDNLIAEGDKVVRRWTLTGTRTGKLEGDHLSSGITPTHKKLKISVITIDRGAGGKFVKEWERYETLGGMQQLGLLLTPRR